MPTPVSVSSLRDVLMPLSLDILTRLVYRCGVRGNDAPIRKDAAINTLVKRLLSPDFVHQLLSSADQIDLIALSDTAHGDGNFDRGHFKAKPRPPSSFPSFGDTATGP